MDTAAGKVSPDRTGPPSSLRTSEDWWAIWCGAALLALSFLAVWWTRPADLAERAATPQRVKLTSPFKQWLAQPGAWTWRPHEAFVQLAKGAASPQRLLPGILGAGLLIAVVFAAAQQCRQRSGIAFARAFPAVFLLALLAFLLAGQSLVRAYNLEYALWALVVGLLISNTMGTPAALRPAVLTEFYIKTGLVLMGAEVLLSRLLALGVPGIFVAWVVTPIVLISTYAFGQKILKMPSPSLNMVISADMSVCGVSAAIATAAACKAKKEELSLAIGLSLAFTVIMMVLMPAVIKAVGMDETLAGAWIGGTIDSTGAVAAAGAFVSDRAMEVAATVKMIQNVLIGFTAFGVALYWVTVVERDPAGPRPSVREVWRRFPKFVLGFLLASLLFSLFYWLLPGGPALVEATLDGSTKTLRSWFFCLAFVSIGLDTNFRQLAPYLRGGKPLALYVCGQTFNLCLTLLMAWLMFRVVFRDLVQ